MKEIATMQLPEKLTVANGSRAENGFTLLETMIALVILAIGVLGLAAMLGNSLSYMQGSEQDFIAQQKAQEAAEAIFTAKYTNNASFAQIQNNGTSTPAGLFLTGPQPLLQVGPDGLVGSVNDTGASPAYIVYPGPDMMLGTSDDIQVPLANYTRTIAISNIAGEPYLRQVIITINYISGGLPRTYTLTTFVSNY
ncbi:MAG: prepilin-type N-terminal cleavage/methylation domain-containing protein [Candidatus Acidiferrales bacterium]|jgi:prepilin-type N-terminal cleavage/methylation domain-containing protein